MIAENHPIVIQGLIGALKEVPNFKIVGVVQNGTELLRILNKTEVDTVIFELKLPATNIYRLIKDLIVTHTNLKLIAFTNYSTPKLVQDVMEYGVHAYLSKIAPIAEIKESITRVHNGEQFISSSVYQKNNKVGKPKSESITEELDQDFIRFSELTAREMDIVILVSRGYTNKDMAEKLFLSKYTIETHRKNLMKKLKLKTSGQLIFFASQQGLV